MSRKLLALLASAGALACNGSFGAQSASRSQFKAAVNQINASYKLEKERCATLSGNARDICDAQAKGSEKVAKAEADAKYRNTAIAYREARLARIEARYGIAKEKCDDLRSGQKSACIKQADEGQAREKALLKSTG